MDDRQDFRCPRCEYDQGIPADGMAAPEECERFGYFLSIQMFIHLD